MIRVLIAAPDAADRETLRDALSHEDGLTVVGLARHGREALALARSQSADAALVADGTPDADILGAELPMVLLSADDGPEALRRALHLGARDHMTRTALPTDGARRLNEAVSEDRRRRAARAAHRPCRVFAVTGAKGGIGKTTVATNLAVALRQETGEPTALIDLYTQFGDVATLLGLEPRHSLADLTGRPLAEIDQALIQDCLMRHETDIRALPAARTPVALGAVSPELLDHVLHGLSAEFRQIVLDVPPLLHPTTLRALAHATQTLLIVNLFDLMTLKDAQQFLKTITPEHVPPERVQIILNRVSRRNGLSPADVGAALERPAAASLPNDGRHVPRSVNRGVPVVHSHPHSPFARSVRHLARALAGAEK